MNDNSIILCFERGIHEFVTCHLLWPVGAGSLINNVAEKALIDLCKNLVYKKYERWSFSARI